jgi:Co/Zn/Cd efflux system component
MRTILHVLGIDNEDKDENYFRMFTFLFIQFVLVSINLFAGFVTNSMSLTACVGYHLTNLFVIGNDVAKNIFVETKAARIGRVVVVILGSVMALVFSAILIDEFFVRLYSPVYFSDPFVWTMLITSMVSTIKSFIYGYSRRRVLKETVVSLTVFVSMVMMMILDIQTIDSYVGLGVSLFVVFLSIKMIVRVWSHRKNF